MKRPFVTALAALVLASACAYKPVLVIRDRDAAAKVKTVAIMPFFDAQSQSAFDPLYKGFGNSFVPAVMFDEKAQSVLGKRYTLIGQDKSLEALKAAGTVYKHVEGAWSAVKDPDAIRWGYTVPQAVQAGKTLGADAVLMCAQGQYVEGQKPLQVLALRLVDVSTGKVLLGLNASGQPGLFSKGVVVNQLLSRIVKEAP